MELKVRRSASLAPDSAAFQSHLYGIESRRGAERAGRVSEFQSHLYGIESIITLMTITHNRVSIAPLWN